MTIVCFTVGAVGCSIMSGICHSTTPNAYHASFGRRYKCTRIGAALAIDTIVAISIVIIITHTIIKVGASVGASRSSFVSGRNAIITAIAVAMIGFDILIHLTVANTGLVSVRMAVMRILASSKRRAVSCIGMRRRRYRRVGHC